jgi:hypothetical protein
MWARKNKNRPVSGFFAKIAYVQVMNFIPVKVSTLYIKIRATQLLFRPRILHLRKDSVIFYRLISFGKIIVLFVEKKAMR